MLPAPAPELPVIPPPDSDDGPRHRYDVAAVERKWQAYWLEHRTFRTEIEPAKPKAYVLDMFPYPSGSGLHVGHPEGYTATDIYCRFLRAAGYNVLHPIGWDAFGLPAEQYAIQTGTHPADTTRRNIDTFRRQIRALGFSYDWEREIDTTDPAYYKWTQWIFLKLFERGLAYTAEVPVNWCPALGTVLANEEVIDGKSERGDHPVVRTPMRQWMLRITAYAERLLAGVDTLQWPEGIKAMQRNWIGRSAGAEVDFAVPALGEKLRVFTTRPDTLYGATYVVVAPEHPLVTRLATAECRASVDAYVAAASRKSDRDRQDDQKEKTGIPTGTVAINPLTKQEVPVWVADYVLGGYGTGAIMAVPAHDTRDFAFAQHHGLPIVPVLSPDGQPFAVPLAEAFTDEGIAFASGPWSGLTTSDFQAQVTDHLAAHGIGARRVNWKLRDWVFSRQRYWGEPIPIYYPMVRDGAALVGPTLTAQGVWNLVQSGSAHIDHGAPIAVDAAQLPLRLPETADFQPTGDAEPPLSRCFAWRFFQQDGRWFARETNTMPQWAGSCWYYLRYLDPRNDHELASPAAIAHWLPVDLYVGGAEHAVLHLLYARFWHKVLFDAGVVPTDEPFQRLVNQGMILGEDGEKMSKSRGNVINPDTVLVEFGADAFRLYEMFMGPLEAVKPWSTHGLHGMRRFLNRVHTLYDKPIGTGAPDDATLRLCHKLIRKVGDDTRALRFNTAIAAMMAALNELVRLPEFPRKIAELFAVLLAPYVPHLAEELWQRLGHPPSVGSVPWPDFDAALAQDDLAEVPVQVNGKVRAKLMVAKTLDRGELERLALAEPGVQRHMAGKIIAKVIVVPGKMVSFVVK
ncbi:MAG: leucine--tRNA ligase [Myxococcales bacterium]|nr:leucine--tRNA ligase [Myxococcales bacterium]